MDRSDDSGLSALLRQLGTGGVQRASDLQRVLGRSQATVSRQLTALGPRVVRLGSGRSTRYALPADILQLDGRQPLTWIDESGAAQPFGRMQYLAGEGVHVEAGDAVVMTRAELPWFLKPLRVQGFLGRERARLLVPAGFDRDPERWSLAQQLFVIASQLDDPPGAIRLGEPAASAVEPVPRPLAQRRRAYEARAMDVTRTLPAGSSAAGEQAKFLARIEADPESGANEDVHVLVKFAPPRGTPFGDRWHDLLVSESIALAVLASHGVAVARTRIDATANRTVLESARFDRVGGLGRRHVVDLDAVHAAFVPGARRHWAASCDALAEQKRLPREDAVLVRDLLAFGRLIGNTDMHFGNLSLFVARDDLARGRFSLAPLYDMLPMLWRPDAATGSLALSPFEPTNDPLATHATGWALEFWDAAAGHDALSAKFRGLARAMRERVRLLP